MKESKITVYKDLYKSKDVPFILSIENCFNRIKEGTVKDKINLLRSLKTEAEQLPIKNSLNCILFAGIFKERNSDGCTQHSGLCIIDFDKYPSDEVMEQQRLIIIANPHVLGCFVSPRGKGYKVVIRIPECDKIAHPKYFTAFQKKFQFDYFDKSNCNIDRVCFESYDPDIYINYNATVFTPVLLDTGFESKERVSIIPINDEGIIIDKIMKFNWTKDFVDGERNSYIFDLAGAFCEYGISKDTAIGFIQNNIVYGEFTESETENTIKSAYKKRNFDTKYFENYAKIEKIKSDLHKPKKDVLKLHNIDEAIFNQIKEVVEVEDFWYTNDKGKIQIEPLKYKHFLERNGFKKYFANDTLVPSFVYVQSNKVSLTSISKIKDFVLNYLIDKKELIVWNYAASFQNLFSDNYLQMLDSIDLKMLIDTKEKSFIAFQNGILEVTKDAIELTDFIDVDGYIWETNILKRDFIKSNLFVNDYQKFIANISGTDPFPIELTIGYLLSTYKNRSNNKAVILNDEIISENPEGGTGKGVFVQGIAHIRKTSIIDGKQFDSKKAFAYQTVSLDTNNLVFDDVKKGFDFEEKFSLVTEGLTLERKNKDAIKLSVQESPKLIISTNYAIKGAGNSHDRRRHEIEISQYYSKNLTPETEFGRQMFDDWNDTDFKNFDNYMVNCLQLFLKNGLVNQNAKNIKLRKFIAETSIDFYEWILDTDNFPINKRNDKAEIFLKFISDNKDFDKLKRNTFTIWVQKYANYCELEFTQNTSNGMKWFQITDKNYKEEDNNNLMF